MENTPQAHEAKLESMIEEFQSGRLPRRELMRRLMGLSALSVLFGTGCSQGQNVGTQQSAPETAISPGDRRLWQEALFSRILNQPLKVKGDVGSNDNDYIVLTDPMDGDERPFDHWQSHAGWIFGADASNGKRNEKNGGRGLRDVVNGSFYCVESQMETGKPAKPNKKGELKDDKAEFRNAVSKMTASGLFKSELPSEFLKFPADFYGAAKAKLDWVSIHSCIHALVFLNVPKSALDPKYKIRWPELNNARVPVVSIEDLLSKCDAAEADGAMKRFWIPLAYNLYHGIEFPKENPGDPHPQEILTAALRLVREYGAAKAAMNSLESGSQPADEVKSSAWSAEFYHSDY